MLGRSYQILGFVFFFFIVSPRGAFCRLTEQGSYLFKNKFSLDVNMKRGKLSDSHNTSYGFGGLNASIYGMTVRGGYHYSPWSFVLVRPALFVSTIQKDLGTSVNKQMYTMGMITQLVFRLPDVDILPFIGGGLGYGVSKGVVWGNNYLDSENSPHFLNNRSDKSTITGKGFLYHFGIGFIYPIFEKFYPFLQYEHNTFIPSSIKQEKTSGNQSTILLFKEVNENKLSIDTLNLGCIYIF